MVVSTEREICIGHRLMDYDGLCNHPHGHNYKVQVTVLGPNPADYVHGVGMFLDFGDLKRALEEVLAPFDHAMMLRNDDPLCSILEIAKNRLVVFPWNPTAENFALFIKSSISQWFRQKYPVTIKVWETSKHFVEV